MGSSRPPRYRRPGMAGCITAWMSRRRWITPSRTLGRSRIGLISPAHLTRIGRADRPWRKGAGRRLPATTRLGRLVNRKGRFVHDFRTLSALSAVLGGTLMAGYAHAQPSSYFGFGEAPPRPPAAVPNGTVPPQPQPPPP